MDHGIDVGPQPQNLAREVVSDTGRARAMEQPAGRHIGDHDVLDAHFLERDTGVLGISEPMREIGMPGAHHHIAERVVDVAAGGQPMRIADELGADGRIEMDGIGHENLRISLAPTQVRRSEAGM